MAEISRFFDSIDDDRLYDATDWSAYFALMIGNGVFPLPGNGLQVTSNGTMGFTIQPGAAFIKGRSYEMTENGADVTVEPANATMKRYARVVIRYNAIDRNILAAVKYSSFSPAPVPPELQRDTEIYELGIADILIPAAAQFIRQQDIKDTRFDSELCGIVTGLLSFLDMSSITAQFEDYFTDYEARVTNRYGEFDSNIATKTIAANTGYNDFLAALAEYMTGAQSNVSAWFATVQGLLDGDAAGNLANAVYNATSQLDQIASDLDALSRKVDQLHGIPHDTTPAWIGTMYLGQTYLANDGNYS
jgi:hypothetical protein